MKITLQASYRRKKRENETTSKIVHRYTVSGSESELALYKSLQGSKLREDENTGQAFYFSTDPTIGNVAELAFNHDNTGVYVKNDERLKMESLAQYYKVDMAQAMGGFIAQSMYQQVMGTNTPVTMPTPAPQPVQAPQPVAIEDGDDPFADEE